MRLSSLLRTALVRLTLIYALAFLGSALVLTIGGALLLSGYMERDIREDIETELASLVGVFSRTGMVGLLDAIEEREVDGRHKDFDYWVQDRSGTVMAGRLRPTRAVEGWTRLVTPTGEEDEPALAKGVGLADAGLLMIARDSEILYETNDFMLEILIWGLGLAFPLALAGGIATSIATLRRIEIINRATVEIRNKGMGGRVPVSDIDDEFSRLASNINAMLEGIETLTESMRQVSNDIAHDLRTPLTRLRQDLERAQEPGADKSPLIARSIERIDEILETFASLLRIANIESGSGRQTFEALDLSELFRDLAETFAGVAEDAGKSMHWIIAEGLRILGDRALLKQMVVNIIENAITHTPPGTRIEIELRAGPQGPEGVIADNGPGIPDWAREKVFRRFFRVDESRQSNGNGLGLSLVAAIARYHGISVALQDNAPGLRVELRFPRDRNLDQ
ncbi:MAG TPA: HAMP domain-containing sensor histidine kinase [Alphaproteobacteria bacterium]|nr:HAMP domain-containing sensor histidine kinase [Alphaproteobacteria bacterium]